MSKEFCLSDYQMNIEDFGNFYLEEPVKKFIKILKEVLKDNIKYPNLTHSEVIDKLAGEKLLK